MLSRSIAYSETHALKYMIFLKYMPMLLLLICMCYRVAGTDSLQL
jgi:hypothetical protein